MSEAAAIPKSNRDETKEDKAARRAAKKTAAESAAPVDAPAVTEEQSETKVHAPEETKEEKKARRKAEKAAAAAPATAENTEVEAVPAASTSAAQSTESTQDAEAVEKKAKKSKKDKKTRKEPRPLAPPEDMLVSTAVAPEAETAPVPTPVSPKADGKKRKRDSEVAPEDAKKPEKRSKKEKKLREQKAAAEAMDRAEREKAIEGSITVDEPAVSKETGSPYDDEELDEQSKKAIGYAHLHSLHHLRSGSSQPAPGQAWKFNKAKQGWLIRNFYNLALIPAKYVDLVVGYLTTIQGGGRKALFTEAKKQLEAPTPAPVASAVDETAPAPATDGEGAADAPIAAEAPAEVMEVDGESKEETTEAAASTDAAPVEDEAAKADREARAARAKTLLKALNDPAA